MYSFWQIAGNRLAGVALSLLAHLTHWRERHHWLNNHGPVQALQRGVALVALVIGIVYTLTGKGQAGPGLADLLDRTAWQHLLWPHQWFGLLLTLSSVLLLVAIYEWPATFEWSAEYPATEVLPERRLRVLLFMQLVGHMTALAFWGMTGLLLLLDCHTSASGWGSMAFYAIHRHLYIRNNKEYEQEAGEIRRWHLRIARAKTRGTGRDTVRTGEEAHRDKTGYSEASYSEASH